MKRFSLVLLVMGLMACGSMPLKQRVSESNQSARQALAIFDDAERQLCQPKVGATNQCSNLAAAQIGLTDAKHQELSRLLMKAFDLNEKVSVAIIAWKAGDPLPTDLATLTQDASEAFAAASAVTNPAFVAKAKTWLVRLQALSTALGGAK